MSSQRIAVIPARGNSKGIPGKNLHPVAGRPLLWYTIVPALESGLFDRVVVSSELPAILSYAESLGAAALLRPPELSQDHVHSVHVVLHAIETPVAATDDTVVSMLLPTSPLRRRDDIVAAAAAFDAAGDGADALVSVYESDKHLLHFRRIAPDGTLEPLAGGNPNVQRQEMDPLYVLNGSIYFSRAGTLRRSGSFHRGRVIPFVMDRRRSIDIDRHADIEDAELRLVS